MKFIKVLVVKEWNRMRIEGNDGEKTFSFDSPRVTLIPISSIRQVQQIEDDLFSILTELVDYHAIGDVQTLRLEVKE